MSMRGINWWKERRHTSHSGIPTASRPATAWNEQKTVEQAILAAFESDAFKAAIASQLDPTIAKLNQIKASNLNLESTLQTHIEDQNDHLTQISTAQQKAEDNLPIALETIQDHLTSSERQLEALFAAQTRTEDHLPDLLKHVQDHLTFKLDALSKGQTRIEEGLTILDPIQDHIDSLSTSQTRLESQLNDLFSGQTRLLKSIETRFDGLESRIEELDRKIDNLDESMTNADLRSAIRFGELSNELQDRNTTLGDRIWEVQRDLGKKVDGQQRRLLGASEELGKDVRNLGDTLESMQEDSSKAISKTESLQRNITHIQEKVSKIPLLSENVSKGMVKVIEALETSRSLASQDSKLNASQLENVVTMVGKVQNLTEYGNEISQRIVDSQATKEDVHTWVDHLHRSQEGKFTSAISTMTRMEGALTSLDAAALSKLEALESYLGRIEEQISPLSAHTTKLDSLELTLERIGTESKPREADLTEIKTTISEMKSNIHAVLLSQDDSLDSIHRAASDTSSFDHLTANLSEMQTNIERKLTSLERIQNSTSATVRDLSLTATNHCQATENLRSTTSTKEDVVNLRNTLLDTLQKSESALESIAKPVSELSTKIDEQATSSLSSIRKIIQAASASTGDEIHEHFRGLDGNLDDRFASMTEAVHERLRTLPITDLLTEVRSTKESSKTALESLHKSLEASKAGNTQEMTSIMSTLHNIQDVCKDDEVLLRIETWGQRGIAKQEGAVELLQKSQERDETLHRAVTQLGERNSHISNTLRSLDVQFITNLQELKSILAESKTEQALQAVQSDVEKIRDDPTLSTIKQLLLQNASSMATAYEGILSIDTKIKTSEESISSAVQDMQTALGRDILDASSSITTSVNDNLADVKIDLVSRVSTSTNVLRAEMKRIDLAATVTAVESLKDDIQSTSKLANEDMARMCEGVRSHITTSVDLAMKMFADTADRQDEKMEEHASCLSHLKQVSMQNSTSLSDDISKIHHSLEPISETKEDVRMIVAAVQGVDHTLKANTSRLAALQESVQESNNQIDTKSGELRSAVDNTGRDLLEAIKDNHSIISNIEKTNGGQLSMVRQEIKELNSEVTKASEAVKKSISSSSAAASADLLFVKSDIGGIITSLLQADHDRSEAEKAQTSILSSVKRTSSELHQIESALKNSNEERQKAQDLMRLDISKMIHDENATIAREMGALSTSVEGSTNGLASQIRKAAEEAARGQELTITKLKTETKTTCDAITAATKNTNAVVDAVEKSILSEIRSAKKSSEVELNTAQSLIQETHKSQEIISADIHARFDKAAVEAAKSCEATLAAIKSEGDSLSTIVSRDSRSITGEISASNDSILSNIQSMETSMNASITKVEKALQDNIGDMSKNITTGFNDAKIERMDSRKTSDANFATVTKSIRHGVEASQVALESANSRMLSEIESTNMTVRSSLEGVKSDLGSVSKYIQTANAGILGEIESLNDKTTDGFGGLASSIGQTNNALSRSIENVETSLQSSLQNISGNMKAVDAAVRVNSAAIARVDKAVLETGSQVKGVVLDGNRDVLFQLDEELHENGTRIRGISEFDIPRLEAIGKRNKDALEVIGARVLGTAKKFDEMVTYHSQKSSDHSELLNGRLRGGSSASSSVVLNQKA